MATQKVVIPKGLVNPNETTIVEIPKELQNVATVVARPRRSSSSTPARSHSPVGPTTYRKRAEKNISLPKRNPGRGFKMLHQGGTSFGGMQNYGDSTIEEAPCPAAKACSPVRQNASPAQRHASPVRQQASPVQQYSTPVRHASPASASPASPASPYRRPYQPPGDFVGPQDREISLNDLSYREFRKLPQIESTLRGIDESMDSTLYREFRPPAMSSTLNATARTPGSVRKYRSQPSSPSSPSSPGSPSSPSSPESSYYQANTTISSAGGSLYQTTEERSHPDTTEESECFCKSCVMKNYPSLEGFDDSSDVSGYQGLLDSTGSSAASPSRQLTQSEVLSSIGDLESSELSQIMEDLSHFQSARRKLIFDASSLSSPGDVSNSILNDTGNSG